MACLEDYYDKLREKLTSPLVDRLEHDPESMTLKTSRERAEIEAIIAERLRCLFQESGTSLLDDDPTAPLASDLIDRLVGLSTREVLRICQSYRERCMISGRMVPYHDGPPTNGGMVVAPDPSKLLKTQLEQAWNDHLSAFSGAVPDDETGLAGLLAGAIRHCSDAIDTGHRFDAERDGGTIAVECSSPHGMVARLRVGICNGAAQGGKLAKQVEGVATLAKDAPGNVTPVIVRSMPFPSNPATKIAQKIGQFLTEGGRRAVVEDAEWRAMAAMETFQETYGSSPAFGPWLKQSRPVSSLQALRIILGLDDLTPMTPAIVAGPEPVTIADPPESADPGPVPVEADPVLADAAAGNGPFDAAEDHAEEESALVLGVAEGWSPGPVLMDPEELKQHAAFLGSTGSGKTTLALNVVEQLLLRGIPAILVDRKGDLCGYARPETWTAPIDDPALRARRDRLRGRLDLAVYTPGAAEGRPLMIDVAPAGLHEVKASDRTAIAQQAASALGGMLGYGTAKQDQARQVVLSRAIEVVAQLRPGAPVTLDLLADFVADGDPALINAIGNLDARHVKALGQDLEVLRLGKGGLLSSEGEPLRVESLLGLGSEAIPGKTRLSIISTKFLPDARDLEFWVAQLLIELGRWASRSPSKRLQAVILLDEADLYLPAVRKPATKVPMENLLRRGRSAGLGVLLASQNPGDFDYKCRDNVRGWFLGRIGQDTSIAKLRPLLAGDDGRAASRLPVQETGQFQFCREGAVSAMRGGRSVLVTEQLPEEEIIGLARSARGGQAATPTTNARSHH